MWSTAHAQNNAQQIIRLGERVAHAMERKQSIDDISNRWRLAKELPIVKADGGCVLNATTTQQLIEELHKDQVRGRVSQMQ